MSNVHGLRSPQECLNRAGNLIRSQGALKATIHPHLASHVADIKTHESRNAQVHLDPARLIRLAG
jgi:hypothetical protein